MREKWLETARRWLKLREHNVHIPKAIEQESSQRDILFCKFSPVSDPKDLPEIQRKPIYRIRGIFNDTEWLRRLGFNHYLIFLQFKMTPDGVKRYIDGEEVEQKFYEEYGI